MKRYHESEWRKKMRIKYDFNNMMEEYIGSSQGINKDRILEMEPILRKAYTSLKEKKEKGDLEWMELPYNQQQVVRDITAVADEIKSTREAFVVLGIGGSALGPIAVHQALNHMHYNELPKNKRKGCPRFYVVDNVDPERMKALFDVVDVQEATFNVITKSGSTSETMAQFLIIEKMLREKLGSAAREHIIATTDRECGNLIKIAKSEGYKLFYIPKGVGGRFSELSPVGLLPAAVCGIDIEEMLAGAAYMDELCQEQDVRKNPASMAALLQYLAMKDGKNISVMMPYADSLKYMADWYAQLWAESLGKKFDLNGREVYAGQTPVKALGVTDQHSQVQLYTEGPFDKVITFIGVDRYREQVDIPHGFEDIPAVSFLGGHSMNELIQTEQAATEYALLKSQKLNQTITLPEVNAFTIGQLIYFFEMQTAYVGELLNINAFDQPGVEEGKNATYALLGRPGYDEKRRELASRPEKKMEYIL